MATYQVGQYVRLSVAIAVDAAATDPSALTLEVRDSAGVKTTKVLSDLTKDATGAYSYVWPVARDGRHYWGFTGTGTAAGAEQTFFDVSDDYLP